MMKLSDSSWRIGGGLSLLILGILLMTAAVACGSGAPTPTPAAPPSITLISPVNGSVAHGDMVTVQVATSGLVMDADGIGKAKVLGRGHWHLYVDGNFIGSTAGTSMEASQIPPGEHHFSVSLHNNDHSPLNPPVETSAVVEVAAP